jgi:hypothetical protein
MLLVNDRPIRKLHREVVNPFRIFAVVGSLRFQPASRQHVAHGRGDRLEPIAKAGRFAFNFMIEHQMPVVRCIRIASESNVVAFVLLENFRAAIGRLASAGAVSLALDNCHALLRIDELGRLTSCGNFFLRHGKTPRGRLRE